MSNINQLKIFYIIIITFSNKIKYLVPFMRDIYSIRTSNQELSCKRRDRALIMNLIKFFFWDTKQEQLVIIVDPNGVKLNESLKYDV